LVQLGEARHEGVVDRALRAEEEHDDGLLVLQARQRPPLARSIGKGEFVDLLPDLGRGGVRAQGGSAGEAGGQRHERRAAKERAHETSREVRKGTVRGCTPARTKRFHGRKAISLPGLTGGTIASIRRGTKPGKVVGELSPIQTAYIFPPFSLLLRE